MESRWRSGEPPKINSIWICGGPGINMSCTSIGTELLVVEDKGVCVRLGSREGREIVMSYWALAHMFAEDLVQVFVEDFVSKCSWSICSSACVQMFVPTHIWTRGRVFCWSRTTRSCDHFRVLRTVCERAWMLRPSKRGWWARRKRPDRTQQVRVKSLSSCRCSILEGNRKKNPSSLKWQQFEVVHAP